MNSETKTIVIQQMKADIGRLLQTIDINTNYVAHYGNKLYEQRKTLEETRAALSDVLDTPVDETETE